MAYKDFDSLNEGTNSQHDLAETPLTLSAEGQQVELPDASYVRDAEISRDGADLVLDGPNGQIVVDGYFAAADAPDLVAPNGETLTPELVNSFAKSPAVYASNASMSDASPVGSVHEIVGEATVTRIDGSTESVGLHTPIYQGDIIETGADGAVNIAFIDETNFAVSEDARLAIDEYVYDPGTEAGAQNFSVLKGVFVFTSGLIGRDDPDDVHIETPVGSIGIRGTIIAGDVNDGEITVVEGAIVLRDHNGNEVTLADQFETAKFMQDGKGIEHQGQMSAEEVGNKFASVSKVSPNLFASINDAAAEEALKGDEAKEHGEHGEEAPAENADGAVDENADGQVDGTVEDGTVEGAEEAGEEHAENTDAEAEMEGDGENGEDAGEEHADHPDQDGNNDGDGEADAPLPPPPPGDIPGGDGDGALPPPPPPPGGDIDSPPGGDGDGAAPPPPPPGGDNGAPPPPPNVINPFDVQVQRFSFQEINTGTYSQTKVATITGINGDIANLSLIGGPNSGGLVNSIFEVIQNADGSYDIFIKAGTPADMVDFDHFAYGDFDFGFGINVTNEFGDSVQGFVSVDIENVNETPEFHENAPNETGAAGTANAFSAAEGETWSYHFDKDFHDPDFGDSLTFTIDGTSLDAAGLSGLWSLDPNTGELTINFPAGFGDTSFSFTITVTDENGLTEDHTYTFEAYDETGTFSPSISGTGLVYVDDGSTNTINLDGSDNKVFLEGSGDTVNIAATSVANELWLGDGTGNSVILNGGSGDDNIVIGGFSGDTFTINSSSTGDDNQLYGMDGDDTFVIGPSLSGNPSTWGYDIDGGHNDFGAVAQALADAGIGYNDGDGGNTGYGDQIELQTTGTINFQGVDNITNIEWINTDNGAGQNVLIELTDVINMTDDHNTLVFEMDVSDTLNITNLNGFDITQDHDGDGQNDQVTIDGVTYDVYTGYNSGSGDHVTILVTEGTTVTGV